VQVQIQPGSPPSSLITIEPNNIPHLRRRRSPWEAVLSRSAKKEPWSTMVLIVVASTYRSHGSSVATKGGRRSTDASSCSSYGPHSRPPISAGMSDPRLGKDTHFYHTTIDYKGHQLPIKMPLFTFPQEVGDVSVPDR
jgi:hypothetical protein